jgi:hypothetical protein
VYEEGWLSRKMGAKWKKGVLSMEMGGGDGRLSRGMGVAPACCDCSPSSNPDDTIAKSVHIEEIKSPNTTYSFISSVFSVQI